MDLEYLTLELNKCGPDPVWKWHILGSEQKNTSAIRSTKNKQHLKDSVGSGSDSTFLFLLFLLILCFGSLGLLEVGHVLAPTFPFVFGVGEFLFASYSLV